MNCPSCSSPLEPNARFCGVCGYRLQAARPAPQAGRAQTPPSGTDASGRTPAPVAGSSGRPAPAGAPNRAASPVIGQAHGGQAQGSKPNARPAARKVQPLGDEVYINQVLNNRFKVESKIGEGGFGAVYRGVQLATGRKVALKLLHPEMTKDENLVARFRREGMVLCNLRDAHTITTYDFDQTPDGTLYIAMELLEGRSLHQVFHEQAPLEWKRMFKILAEMCSSLAEAHAQGIVHRDLKPENVYLENRPGNPEFVKILDFGIAKVMRGDSIDPASPQLTATGQTLGTLEYMSPEQLMGKPLDGRSDVYALGVVAYEMITGRLPFPEAKGPAGLITAQLKQTPQPPSQVNAKSKLPAAGDEVILRCLEKDKNKRFPDVSMLSVALQEVIDAAREASNPVAQPLPASSGSIGSGRMPPQLLETVRGEAPANLPPPPAVSPAPQMASMGPGAMASPAYRTPGPGAMTPLAPAYAQPSPAGSQIVPQHLSPAAQPLAGGSTKWIWWILGLLALGAVAGAVLALVMK